MVLNKKSFSIIEIIAVVILAGILTAFAMANYWTAIEKSEERVVIGNLTEIRAAAELYMINTSSGLPNMANLNAINNTLGIRVADTTTAYSCSSADNECRAIHPKGWEIHFHDTYNQLLHCDAGTACPRCPQGVPTADC